MEAEIDTWRGVALSEIYGSMSPWDAPEFPLVSPAYNHAVLYHMDRDGLVPADRPPSPQRGRDKWDNHYIRMPCSQQSLYPVMEEDGTEHLKKRWDIIKIALNRPMNNSNELADTILTYNTKFKNQWKFRALHYLFNEYLEEEESAYFFNVTLPEIAKLALSLPRLVQAPIPLLQQHKNRAISLTQEQVASLLANAFFCTFPRRNTTKKTSEYASYPHINFNSLYCQPPTIASVMEKLKCICHYFRRVCTKVPSGVLTFMRRTVEPTKCPKWSESDLLLGGTPLHVNSSGTIEDNGVGLIQIDFANKYLGGGVLNSGCVQEEIRFVICPELLVSMLFTEVLRPTEALLMIGCERFSSYTGYASSFQWACDYADTTPFDSSGRRRCAVLAIDALYFAEERNQFRADLITRELNKAWVGVSSASESEPRGLVYPGIATGNWGCGAFRGSPTLKSLLQLMACTGARRPMAYYTFGDVELRNTIINMYNFLSQHNITVGQLYKYIIKFSQKNLDKDELYPFIYQLHLDEERPDDDEVLASPEVEYDNKMDASLGLNLSPDLFSSSEPDSFPKDFVDLEKGEGSLHLHQEIKIQGNDAKKAFKFASRSSLFDAMTQFDAENSNLNLNNKSATLEIDNKKVDARENVDTNGKADAHEEGNKYDTIDRNLKEKIHNSHHALDIVLPVKSDEEMTSVQDETTEIKKEIDTSNACGKSSAEVEKSSAKKMARKITDYFNKKS